MTCTKDQACPSTGDRRRSVSSPSPPACEHPLPRPKQDQRRLTRPPSSSPPETRSLKRKQAYDEPKSGLLTKLFAEIRLMIWESVIGRLKLHILSQDGKLGYLICKHPCLACYYGSSMLHYIGSFSAQGRRAEGGLLSLLRTCRQVYVFE